VPQPSDESYRRIPLTKGQTALVDAEDYEYLMQWNWHAHWDPSCNGYYARQNHSSISMHYLITGKKHMDHKNRDGLDNRKRNLRDCSHEENCRNRKPRSDSRTGLKGVYWAKGDAAKGDKGSWAARIQINGKRIMLGRYPTPEGAAKVYDFAALCLFGEFAVLNFP
jgi:hypothetical protein